MGCRVVYRSCEFADLRISGLQQRWHQVALNKMVSRMAASVCCSLVLLQFLFICPVLSNVFPISFTRNKLLDIRNSTPDNLLPTFDHSDVLLDILVGGAAFLYKHCM